MNYTWISSKDYHTGEAVSFNALHVVLVRDAEEGGVYVMTSTGVRYHVTGSRAELIAALTGAK